MNSVRAVFYDTWGFLALANAADPDHAVAVEADRWREAFGRVMVTSDFVLDETLTALHRTAGATVTLRFLDLLEARVAAERVMLVEVHAPRREAAVRLFRLLAPRVPRLSFTDCTSLALMEDLGIQFAFTADRHFRLAGEAIRPLFVRRRNGLAFEPPSDTER